jgi:alginate O-acetyltransferase complex protein AlgJ
VEDFVPDSGYETVGVDLDFTSAGNLSTARYSGFSVPEPAGTWSLGTASQLRLRRPPHDGTTFTFRLAVYPHTAEGFADRQLLAVRLNGAEVFRQELRTWTDIALDLPTMLFSGHDDLVVDFSHPDAFAPVDTGRSIDVRPLGFLFRNLTIRCRPPPPGESPSDPANHTSAQPLEPPPAWPAVPAEPIPNAAGIPTKDVHVGHDNWLFLIGGSNNVLRYFTDPLHFDRSHAADWADILIARRDLFASMGIRYLHIAPPDKLAVYPEQVRIPLPNLGARPVALVAEALARRGAAELMIDPLPRFKTSPDRPRLYMKNDTHWTIYAGAIVLAMVVEAVQHKRDVGLDARVTCFYQHPGDLGSKLTPPRYEEYVALQHLPTVRRTHANDLAELFEKNVRVGKPVVHGGIHVVFENSDPGALQEKLVIFGDSFMDFQPSNTTMLFAEHFREVHFVWSRDIDFGYAGRVAATIVISEIAERFMSGLPTDDYDVERHAAGRLEQIAAAEASSAAGGGVDGSDRPPTLDSHKESV